MNVGIISIILIIIIIYLSTNWLKVSDEKVAIKNLPKGLTGLKIVHLSDLHGKDFGQGNQQIADIINKADPDFIVCTGDMVDRRKNNGTAFIDLLQKLKGKYPIYYSLGNHENQKRHEMPGVYLPYEQKVRQNGVIILKNKTAAFEKNGDKVLIFGLNSIPYQGKTNETDVNPSDFNLAFIRSNIGEPVKGCLNILLAHDPSWFRLYSSWGADMVLSGHVHGGAVRLPFLGGIFSPNRGLFPKYSKGLYQMGNTMLNVSPGLGTSIERIRIFNRPEIDIITFAKED